MQGLVNGAYADVQFGGEFNNSHNKIRGLFAAAEQEERSLSLNHSKTVEQNAILVVKAQELQSYNARIYSIIESQKAKLIYAAQLRERLAYLTVKSETAGFIETRESVHEEACEPHDTGRANAMAHAILAGNKAG
jgi:hypothetical protein